MTEETEFWGLAVEGYDDRGHPTSVLLMAPGTAPDGKPFHFYPVFSSREGADEFVGERGPQLGPELTARTRANIRPIKRNEIPDEHSVSLDRADPVTWAELLQGAE